MSNPNWLIWIAPAIQLVALAVVIYSGVIQRRTSIKMRRYWVREGVVMGGLHRRLNLPPSLDVLLSQKPTFFEKGYMHGYLSMGRRLERERGGR